MQLFIFSVLDLNNYEPGPDVLNLLDDFERVTSQERIEQNALIYS